MKIFENDLVNLSDLLKEYQNGPVEINELTIKDNTPELIFIINQIKAKNPEAEIIINTDENINNSPMKLMALKQYKNLIIRAKDKDFKLS